MKTLILKLKFKVIKYFKKIEVISIAKKNKLVFSSDEIDGLAHGLTIAPFLNSERIVKGYISSGCHAKENLTVK